MFGAVYEIFSHGVFSAFMAFAFLIPLFAGFLPFLLLSIAGKSSRGDARFSLKEESRRRLKQRSFYPSYLSSSFYHSGVIVFTVGSIVTGILEIYGTTNALTGIYWLAGAALMLLGILSHLFTKLFQIRKFLYRQ